MKLKPILFSTPMVQAILEGRKSMTRRIIKSRHESGLFQVCRRVSDGQIMSIESLDWDERNCEKYITPKYRAGDILWVREAWRIRYWDFEDWRYTVEYKDGFKQVCDVKEGADDWLVKNWEKHIKKDYLAPSGTDDERFQFTDKIQPFSPSIHMPYEAARIFLEVTNVRAERLQDISPDDACNEGVNYWNIDVEAFEGGELQADFENYTWKDDPHHEDYWFPTFGNPVDSFRTLWESINGPGSWEANPWVFVYDFKRVEKPIN